MRYIDKGPEPPELTAWKRANPKGNYAGLSEVERQAIREACTSEQFYLCAYCCQPISGENNDTMNEHVEARHQAKQRSLDFSNLVASCTSPRQCDAAHGSQPLPLTPLMFECETELRFKLSGRVEGLTERARESIRVLNLGDTEASNKALVEKRKRLSEALLWEKGVEPDDILDDEALLRMVIDDISQPQDGKLPPFAPVVANMLSDWLGG
ncbi:HNH endonuclease family protein [Zobellella maritima]|uniref:TIGR02646 family protein n=1 Tax=Zobellella maritima TaxID=2059725 RepID=UPI000E301214|nr:TIGR02646 family protein [Zobellella maritima]